MATETTKDRSLIRGLRDRFLRNRRPSEPSMDLARRDDPFGVEPMRMMREMMRMDPFRMFAQDMDAWLPHFEVRENGNAIRIMADVPGVRRDDLEIAVSGNRLIVSGEREAEQRAKDENVHAWERRFGHFMRSFTLPDNVDLDHVTSELREGVLTIVVPLKAGSERRKIAIGGGQPKS
jgi:HSP20 family protein